MSALSLLRACRGARHLIARPSIFNQTLIKTDVSAKMFSVTPAVAMQTPEYFKARRGPFTPAEKQGDHKMMASTHWKIERILAVSMLGILPACLFVQGPVVDFALSMSVLMHGFWGVDGVCTDYIEKFFPPIHFIWYCVTIAAIASILYFNYNDVGVTKAISMIWKL